MAEERPRVLILAGTAEGRAVAETLAVQGTVAPVLSLAGLTEAEAPAGVVVRRGGFGGVGGLASYLKALGFAALVDATHPFAARMHHHATEAARQAGTPCFRVQRRPWLPQAGDRWEAVDALETGLDRLRGRFTRVFATSAAAPCRAWARSPTCTSSSAASSARTRFRPTSPGSPAARPSRWRPRSACSASTPSRRCSSRRAAAS